MTDPGNRTPVSVLVIDEDRVILGMLEMALAEFVVHSASTAQQAETTNAQQLPTVVVADLHFLGQTRAVALLEAMHLANPDLRLILMSASTGVGATFAGCPIRYLGKPFLLKDLIEEIRDAVSE